MLCIACYSSEENSFVFVTKASKKDNKNDTNLSFCQYLFSCEWLIVRLTAVVVRQFFV